MMGGPDFWQVYGVGGGDYLNIRSGAGTSHGVVGTAVNDDILRNHGCTQNGNTIWCEVEKTDGSGVRGWASNAYLREGAMPSEAGDAIVPGTNYNATGSIPCMIEADPAVTSCEFGVTRGNAGIATVFITLPNGFVRVVEFADGEVKPMSEVRSFETSRSPDDTTVDVDGGAEVYTIPDAVPFGG